MLVEATNNTRKFVLPVCKMPMNGDGGYDLEKAELGGTCFLVGRRGFALTAAHVIRDIGPDEARVFFPVAGEWDVCPITKTEFHPKEDICIIKVDLPEEVVSPVIFAADEPFPGSEYHMWAYPDVIAEEIKHHGPPEKDCLPFNPSPVYFRGYLRRKISYSPNPNLSIYIGEDFFTR